MADASHLRVVVVNFWFYELNVLVNWRAEFGFSRSTPHRTFEYGSPLKIENHCARLTNDICTRTPARALSEDVDLITKPPSSVRPCPTFRRNILQFHS